MRKGLLIGFLSFACFSFAQTWSGDGITLNKNGSLITVKWTNGSGTVTTKKASCSKFPDSLMDGVYCYCNNGDYFTLSAGTKDFMTGRRYLYINFYNELDNSYWGQNYTLGPK
jgi:hypothetical protein